MEPEKPPRRQTSDKTPTTIDLTADRLPSNTDPGAAAEAAPDLAASTGSVSGADKAADTKPADAKPAPIETASSVPVSDPAKSADTVAAKTATDAPKPNEPAKGDPLAASSTGSQSAPVRAWDRPSDLPGAGSRREQYGQER